MSSRAAHVVLLYTLQAAALLAALGIALTAFASMGAGGEAKERRPCGPLRMAGWAVLPLAFLSGGLINIPGFASAAVLLV
mmetsp:Transcript_124042/g.362077  ORF Transcript_124042/g.362077 Transcript_124042/m.362077 type:complete len:80 (+) Transcript_124042:74-313(+)